METRIRTNDSLAFVGSWAENKYDDADKKVSAPCKTVYTEINALKINLIKASDNINLEGVAGNCNCQCKKSGSGEMTINSAMEGVLEHDSWSTYRLENRKLPEQISWEEVKAGQETSASETGATCGAE
jgi:hypothetical protein